MALAAPTGIRRSADHRYSYEGSIYPGVTGILKVIDKSDALMAWAARNTAEAALAQLDNLASLRATVGPEGVVKALTSRSAWKRDEAASIGSEIHAIADRIAKGQDTGLLSTIVLERAQHYAAWWAASGWTLRLSEGMLVHPAAGYGGTFDLLAYDRDGRTVLADIKTGRNVYPEGVLQLTAYGLAPLVQPEGSYDIYPMPTPNRYVLLHVTATGVREIEVPVGQLEQDAWNACLALHSWQQTIKGRRL